MSLIDSLRRSLSRRKQAAAHMTWATRSISQSVSTTRLFLKRQLWVWPIIAVVVLAVLGWGVNSAIESTMKAKQKAELQTLRDVETAMLERWMTTQEHNVESMANNSETRRIVEELLVAKEAGATNEEQAAKIKELSAALGPAMTSHGYIGYTLIDRNQIIVAASEADILGRATNNHVGVAKALDGATGVSAPFKSVAALKLADGTTQTGVPTMYATAPVRDDNLQVVAVLGMRIQPQRDFTKILQLGRTGDSGETYAFNKDGLMLSNSRFDDELIRIGILADLEGSESILQVLVRDPGGDMTKGFEPPGRRSTLPPTRMVADAIEGGAGVDVEGYRDYRGVPVIGAWRWLDKYNFGVATEINKDEAFLPLTILKRTFRILLGLLILSSIAIFLFTIRVARLQRQAREAAVEAKQLGQYQLEQKLGAGAMGVVYKGRHAMMRRPTAIKLLDADTVTPQSIARFEREVQITAQLTHPNTVAIYDFGRTPEDVFYYAMEYLEGINLQTLVEQYGPQPPSRVIHILRQVCGSLYEAHSMGLVHRDIKPANLMLTRRGGEADVVKVLDFGLVKARDDADGANEDRSLAGTPLYMSPEAIQLPSSVDGCSDIYAVGAVGYFLLTGHPVFEAASIIELCNKHVSETPMPPSQRVGKSLPEDFENAILACLEKLRSKRPQTARDLAQRLARCPEAMAWTIDDAEAWWSRHERGLGAAHATPAAAATLNRQYEATIDQS
jgi:tRNA A-37 threonylcarbamoyl transferase component Bud32